jgi:hypothetical protein
VSEGDVKWYGVIYDACAGQDATSIKGMKKCIGMFPFLAELMSTITFLTQEE